MEIEGLLLEGQEKATEVQKEQTKTEVVTIQGRLHYLNTKKKLTFLTLRSQGETIQCLVEHENEQLKRHLEHLVPETILRVTGRLQSTSFPIRSCTRENEELIVTGIEIISKPTRLLPFNLVDAERSISTSSTSVEQRRDEKSKSKPTVEQAHRLDHRSLDLRTLTNYSLMRLNSKLVQIMRNWLLKQNFTEIFTPKITGSATEGGSDVFAVNYYGNSAFLTQSPQLYKQMAINGDLMRVFEVGPIFRAEKSHTHRHLSQFTGFDLELEVDSYEALLCFAESFIINLLEEYNRVRIQSDEAIYLEKHLGGGLLNWVPTHKTREGFNLRPSDGSSSVIRVDYWTAIDMLNRHYSKEATSKESTGLTYSSDLNTEQERTLGQLVKDQTGVDFFILNHFPLNNRAFYTAELPAEVATVIGAPSDVRWSCGFDLILCGEEISSGALRINDPKVLLERCLEKGIANSLDSYLESFEYGSPLHGGFGLGLERILMLLFKVPNVKQASLFPRYPERLSP